jgi:hypothetical protein
MNIGGVAGMISMRINFGGVATAECADGRIDQSGRTGRWNIALR